MLARRSLTLLLALAGALLAVTPALAGGKPDKGAAAQPPTDQIVIRMMSGKSLDTSSLDSTAGVDLKQLRRLGDGSYVLKLSKRHDEADVRAITDKLAARGDVLSAEPDALLQPLAAAPSDSSWNKQWDMSDPATGKFGINLLSAWDLTPGSPDITIGVIDTGYRPHYDLGSGSRFVGGYDFIWDPAVAGDGDGRDGNPIDTGDYVTSAESASGPLAGCDVGNSSWHGTHVAGTIGAVANNPIGPGLQYNVVGINQLSGIQPIRVLGKCGGYNSDIADAIRWAAGISVAGVPPNPTPDRVVNISLGGSGACGTTMQSAINDAVALKTVVVVAAGNSNANAANFSPANCSGVITVAATGPTGKRAYYSNYGTSVEIAAPGGDAQLGTESQILSTLNAGTQGPGGDSYAWYQGTSMATPHVVGVVSLMLSIKPSLTPAQVLSLLQSSSTKFPAGSTCTTSLCGAGIANAGAAVAAANGGTGPPPPPGPFVKTSPTNGTTVPGTSVTLSWGASPNATSYSYCLETIGTSCLTGWVPNGSATTVTVPGRTPGTSYNWQVQATNATGTIVEANGTGAWWTFSMQAAPPPPSPPGPFAKSSPSNGATNQKNPTLTWTASTGATSYQWCISTVNSTTCQGTWSSPTTARSAKPGFSGKTTYYWQVRALNASPTQTYANGSGTWSFRTR